MRMILWGNWERNTKVIRTIYCTWEVGADGGTCAVLVRHGMAFPPPESKDNCSSCIFPRLFHPSIDACCVSSVSPLPKKQKIHVLNDTYQSMCHQPNRKRRRKGICLSLFALNLCIYLLILILALHLTHSLDSPKHIHIVCTCTHFFAYFPWSTKSTHLAYGLVVSVVFNP